jgi:tyrosinase
VQYWNWGRYAANPEQSIIFNGNASSMGGNGAKVQYNGVSTPGGNIPPADGGGCVSTGPFAK